MLASCLILAQARDCEPAGSAQTCIYSASTSALILICRAALASLAGRKFSLGREEAAQRRSTWEDSGHWGLGTRPTDEAYQTDRDGAGFEIDTGWWSGRGA